MGMKMDRAFLDWHNFFLTQGKECRRRRTSFFASREPHLWNTSRH
jgi:hypothetical protein